MTIEERVLKIARDARASTRVLAGLSSAEKEQTLRGMASGLIKNSEFLLTENRKDVDAGRGCLSAAMLDRLTLNQATIEAMARGIEEVAALPDPVGKVTSMWKRPNGLTVGRMEYPLG